MMILKGEENWILFVAYEFYKHTSLFLFKSVHVDRKSMDKTKSKESSDYFSDSLSTLEIFEIKNSLIKMY